jgi:hypothetical protein
MTTHAAARQFARVALERRFGNGVTSGEVKALAGIGWLETNYGAGWKGDGANSNNIGAIHADPSWSGDVFLSKDTRPNADGSSTEYYTRFKKYATAADGWNDLVDTAFIQHGRSSVRAAARVNDWLGVSTALYQTGYYEGFGATDAERIAGHRKALQAAISAADEAAVADLTPSITIRVQNPQGDRIGTAQVSEASAPGLSALAGIYGAPVMIAYPNGWRTLQFAPDVQLPIKPGLAYTPVEQQTGLSFGWQSGAALGILGLVATIFFGTLSIQPGRRAHAG